MIRQHIKSSRWEGRCASCRSIIPKGAECYYYPSAVRGQRVRCIPCGSKADPKEATPAELDAERNRRGRSRAPVPQPSGSGDGQGGQEQSRQGSGGGNPADKQGMPGARIDMKPDAGKGQQGSGQEQGQQGQDGQPSGSSGSGQQGQGGSKLPDHCPATELLLKEQEKRIKEKVGEMVPDIVDKAVKEAANKMLPKRIEIIIPKMPKVDATGQHKMFPRLISLLAIRSHVWLAGPAGSGKTEAARLAAEALGLPFYCQSVCEQTSLFQLLGNVSPSGEYVPSMFYKAYSGGGIFLLDEVDSGNANVLTVLNNYVRIKDEERPGKGSFPGVGMINEHPTFTMVAGANTWGAGANRSYVGRLPIDGATLSRFARLPWDYDEQFERRLASNPAWVSRVQAIRRAVDKLGVRMIVSPRATFSGERMLAAGIEQDEVEDMLIWNGQTDEIIKRVKAEIVA